MKVSLLKCLFNQIYTYTKLSFLATIFLLSLSLTACSVHTTSTTTLEDISSETSTMSPSESSKDQSNSSANSTENTPSKNSTSESNSSESSDSTTTIIEKDDVPIQPNESFTVTETSIVGYHDLITQLHNLDLPIDLGDIRLNALKAYLGEYDFNFTNNQIGQISAPDSLYVLCNKLNQLSKDYVPNNLRKVDISFTFAEDSEKKMLRDEAATALESLFLAAKEAGFSLYGLSGYRSYNTQINNYTSRVNSLGTEGADRISARPGHSEHQTGLTMDITSESASFKLIEGFGETPEGLWVKENAHLYGFIIRYQDGTSPITGYNYEPWHLRYITPDVASYLYENHITVEELYASLLGK